MPKSYSFACLSFNHEILLILFLYLNWIHSMQLCNHRCYHPSPAASLLPSKDSSFHINILNIKIIDTSEDPWMVFRLLCFGQCNVLIDTIITMSSGNSMGSELMNYNHICSPTPSICSSRITFYNFNIYMTLLCLQQCNDTQVFYNKTLS